jgi:hypothetical protein
VTAATHSPRQLAAAFAVVLALAALAGFALWGMRPSASSPSSTPAPVTAPAAPPAEREEGGSD